jgi:hypothetical protein
MASYRGRGRSRRGTIGAVRGEGSNLCRSREIACSCAAADEIEALHVDAVRVEHRQKRGGIAGLQLDRQLDFAVPRRELGLPPPAEFLDGLRVLVVNVPE